MCMKRLRHINAVRVETDFSTLYSQCHRNVGHKGTQKKTIFSVLLRFFGSTITTSRFAERFRERHYSFASFCLLFFYSRCLRAEPFVKLGALHLPPCPVESALLSTAAFKKHPKTYPGPISSPCPCFCPCPSSKSPCISRS